jgi:uncharacterized membrane protein YgcG
MKYVIALLAFCLVIPLRAEERILDFHSAIAVGADGGLTVRERIAVRVEGKEIKRGILRDFPTRYTSRFGYYVSVPFRVSAVTRNGKPERYSMEQLRNGERIRIGDANVLLPHGEHVYEITYQTSRQLGFFERHDELYWNVNGTGWTFFFERLSAEVTLPQPVRAGDLRIEAYTGPQGARGRDYVAEARERGAAFRTTRALAPGEGVTLVVGFPKGMVRPPRARGPADLMADNPALAAGLAGLALLVAFLWGCWFLFGRDPSAAPRFPRYEPPPGLGPAGVRYIERMGYDDRCLAAALLGLGSRGFIKIRQAGARFGIEPTGKNVEPWLPGELVLARELVPAQGQVWLEPQHDPAVRRARNIFWSELDAHFGNRFFSRSKPGGRIFAVNRWPLFLGNLILILTIVAIIALDGERFLPDRHVAPLIGVVIAMLVALKLFARWLPAYSVKGRKLKDAIDGLRQYLSVAEANDLARMKAPPQTKEEFAKFLPYAVALNVEKTWAERFVATLGAAAVAAAVADYYSSRDWGDSGPGNLGNSFSGLSDTVVAASTPPAESSGSSDSGGGGGSSGGGGGGGGGSGW